MVPHPATHPEFYENTVSKRLLAWIADVVLISALTALASVFTFLTALFFLPLLYAVISFLYRWTSLARASATPGMRLFALELRQDDGAPLDTATAFLHTAGYFVSVAVFPLQLISVALMLMSEKRQGLTDMVIGTVALNARAT